MVNKNWIIIILAVIVAALIAGFWWYDHTKLKKASANWQMLYYACKNAPADTVIHYDSIYVQGGTMIKLVPIKTVIHDTIIKVLRENWYDSTFRQGGIRFRYQARTMGELRELVFSEFVWPKEVVTITRRVDTCLLKPAAYKPMLLHWGVYSELVTDNFTKFPGIGLGGQIIIKDRLTISAGGLYTDRLMGSLRVGVLFK